MIEWMDNNAVSIILIGMYFLIGIGYTNYGNWGKEATTWPEHIFLILIWPLGLLRL